MTTVIGYPDRWSVRAGESLTVFAHADATQTVVAEIVPLTRFDDTYREGPPAAGCAATHFEAGPQRTTIGSYGTLPMPAVPTETPFTFSLLVKPTTAHDGVIAALVSGQHPALVLRWTGMGRVAVQDRAGEVLCTAPLAMARWSSVALTVQAGRCSLRVAAHGSADAHTTHAERAHGVIEGGTIWLAALPDADGNAIGHFDGLIEAPALHAAALTTVELSESRREPSRHAAHASTIAAWDFSRETQSDRLIDVGPLAAHGTLHQGPVRLVPGAFWTAGLLDPARAPERFGAVHFHRDDIRDAGWAPSATVAIPAALPSGVYGLRLRGAHASASDVIPFWVRPARGSAARPLAFLAPTFTYLAYGNAPSAMLGPAYWGAEHPAERLRKQHPEFGPSLYSRHPDHSGVSLASRHRPILTVRPGVRPWGFEADRLLTDWMDRNAFAFDVLTDEDLHAEGNDALSPYRVIVTGNHPEYWSSSMLDALEHWLARGGRLVYTGGNGFYWRITSLDALPGVIECRRAEGGTRPWIAEPGCGHHQLDGEPGGMWRRLGRTPQQLVGVGFAGQGFAASAAYRVRDEARATWAGFVLEGITASEFGTTGRFGNGAAGQEIDRYDVRLGSSVDAVVLASSQGLHDAATLRTLEELLSHEPYAPDAKVRADLTLTPTGAGGAVLATGSMAWVGALDDPGVARVMTNVLTRFLQPDGIGPTMSP